MLPLRYTLRWRIAGVCLLATVFLGALLPVLGFLPRMTLIAMANADKGVHLVAFTLLTLWFSGQYAGSAWWRIAIGLTLFGVAIELCQRMTVYRSAEWLDLAADVAGIAIGLCIAWAGVGGWSLRFENWLLKRQTV